MIHWTPAKKVVAILAALGVGALIVQSRKRYHDHNSAPVTLDPELSPVTRKAVLHAIVKEHDPAILQEFSRKLAAAGYHKSAEVIAIRATQVSDVVSGYG